MRTIKIILIVWIDYWIFEQRENVMSTRFQVSFYNVFPVILYSTFLWICTNIGYNRQHTKCCNISINCFKIFKGDLIGGKNPCKGDDGDPAVRENFLVGIVCYINKCGQPVVYTDVATVSEWLLQQIRRI